jgi:hypothetical protein
MYATPSIGPPSGMLANVPPGYPVRFALSCDGWLRNRPYASSEQAAVLAAWLFDRAVGPVPLSKAMANEVDQLLAKLVLDPARSRRAIAAWKPVGEAGGRFAVSLGSDDPTPARRQV